MIRITIRKFANGETVVKTWGVEDACFKSHEAAKKYHAAMVKEYQKLGYTVETK